ALLEIGPELGRGARALQSRLAPVELGLAGCELVRERRIGGRSSRDGPLALGQLLLALRQRCLALVELGDPLERRLRALVLAGGALLAQPVGGGRALLLLR